MRRLHLDYKRWPPTLCLLLGVCMIALAGGADLVGLGGRSGWGGKQTLTVVTGFVVMMVGVLLATPGGQRFILDLSAPSAESKSPVPILGLAIWFGIATGLIEVSIFVFRKHIEGLIIYRSQDFLWTIPLGETGLFIVAGLALSGAARLWHKLGSLQYTNLVFIFLSLFSLLLRFPELHILALLVLAGGVATQSARFTAAHRDIFYVIVRGTIPILIASVAVLWIGVRIWSALPEWAAYLAISSMP